MVRYIETRGFWLFCGMVLAGLLFFKFYRGRFAIERTSGKIALFQEKAS